MATCFFSFDSVFYYIYSTLCNLPAVATVMVMMVIGITSSSRFIVRSLYKMDILINHNAVRS